MSAALFLVGAALAGEPAHYHPDDIAKASKVFGAVAASMGPAFEDSQSRIGVLGAALTELELGVGLLGAEAPTELVAWSLTTRKKVVGETLRLQRHVDLLQEDYGRVFGAAVERALPTVGRGFDLRVCGATGVLAMIGKKDCAGTDLNPKFASSIDIDTTLARDLADIASVEWPSFEEPKAAASVVALTGSVRWVSGGVAAQALLGARVATLQEDLERKLDQLLPDAPTKDDLVLAQAEKTAYLATLGADGQVLRAAIQGALARAAKKGGPAEVAWCANPVSLGGCPGEDATQQVLDLLGADKKFLKEIARMNRE